MRMNKKIGIEDFSDDYLNAIILDQKLIDDRFSALVELYKRLEIRIEKLENNK